MKKRWTAVLLAIVLAAALLPAPALAVAEEVPGPAGSRLADTDLEIYKYLKQETAKIAAGTRANAEIKIPDIRDLYWTLEELGAVGESRENILAKLEEKFPETVHIRRIHDCLTADCSFEMFWRSDQFSWGYSVVRQGDRAYIRDLTIRFQVAEAYRGASETVTDRAKIDKANQAAKKAQAIVEQHRDESDLEKLTAYREEICRLASYDSAAANSTAPYGDPWQLIYVFDGDPDTNVVCEGYAKAFKYLCDLTEFDGDVVCWTVSGSMNGESHMWNVVQMGSGGNYLTDVTNCDTGTIGADSKLFLSGAAGTLDGRTYIVAKEHCLAVYTYSEDQQGMYTDGYPAISGADYAEGAEAVLPVLAPVHTAFTDVDPEAYYAGPVAWAVAREITRGTADDAFSPDEFCTHGQILTFLWRAAGEPASDTEAPLALTGDEYYASAVRWASGLEMLGESFDPAADCTRSDAVWYIWHAFDGPDAQVGGFTDVPVDSPYAHAVGWAVLEGVTTGASETAFEPDAICSRGQIVTFLYRAYH